MFTARLTRAAQRASSSTVITPAANTTSNRATQCLASRKGHHRRHSSSKASCPPDSSSNGKPAPATKAASSHEQPQAPVPAEETQRSTKGRPRTGFRRSTATQVDKIVGPIDQYAGLPSVPSTQGIETRDLPLSTFFSMHRPMSLSVAVPPRSSEDHFNRIFETRLAREPWQGGNSAERRPEDFIYTLHPLVEQVEEPASGAQDNGAAWTVVHDPRMSSNSVVHLDGQPKMKSLEEVVGKFSPFLPPPPPEPFEVKKFLAKKAAAKPVRKAKRKAYTTLVTVVETTGAFGQRTWSASATPIKPMTEAEERKAEDAMREQQDKQDIPKRNLSNTRSFAQRMAEREEQYSINQQRKEAERAVDSMSFVRRAPSDKRLQAIRMYFNQPRQVTMYLISVKRQRKLKMKKHKYKKLMKRTRNLRRKLEKS